MLLNNCGEVLGCCIDSLRFHGVVRFKNHSELEGYISEKFVTWPI